MKPLHVRPSGIVAVLAWLAASLVLTLLAGCGVPQNRLPLEQRSQVIDDAARAEAILARASLETVPGPQAHPLKIVHLQGSPYEMGFQHGVLLKKEIQALYRQTFRRVKILMAEDMLDEVFDLMVPYIPREEMEEMRGLAHGADLPLRLVHWLHAVPEISEYGDKKKFRRDFAATSCSNVAAFGAATADGELYHLRVLDWTRDLGVQKWPVVLVHHPDEGYASATFSYAGFVGAVSGMNARHLSFGEKGYGNPPGESLEGMPFVFLFRKLMREAATVEEARDIIAATPRTNSYLYVIADGKRASPTRALLLLTDRERVAAFGENTPVLDPPPGGADYPAIDDVVYGGAKGALLTMQIRELYGQLGPPSLMEMARVVSLDNNLQNVIFKPATLEAWLANATAEGGEPGRAAHQPWLHLDLAPALNR